MGRAPLLLLLLAVLGAGWLLKDTLFDPAPGEGADTAAMDADGDLLEGSTTGTERGDGGPALATPSEAWRQARASRLSDAASVAERALGAGPASATVHFTGLVKSITGGTLSDVEVVAVGDEGPVRFRAGDDGRFEKTLPAGRYDLLFRGANKAALYRNHGIDGSLTADAEFILHDTNAIAVFISRGEEPVPGVPLEAKPDGQFADMLKVSATTGADGSARFEGLPIARYTLTGTVPEGPQVFQRVNLAGGAEGRAVIVLPEGVQFSGTVRLGKDGPPVPHARMALQVRPRRSSALLGVDFTAQGDGTFDVFVPMGRPMSFSVKADGLAPFPSSRQRNGVIRALGRLRRNKPVKYDVVLDAGLGISGVVTDLEDKPVSGVRVGLRRTRNREAFAEVTTGDDGRYGFTNLAREVYDLGILTPGLFPMRKEHLRLSFKDEPIEKNIQILAARRVSGKVVTPTGAAVPAARVWVMGGGIALRSARDAGRTVEAYTSADGSFLLADLPTDKGLSIRASMGQQEAQPVVVAAKDETPAPIRLVLEATGEIHGQVVDKDTGDPLANVYVRVRPDPRDGRTGKSARTRGDGHFTVRGLIPGSWHLTPRLRGYLQHRGDVVEVTAGEVDARIELDPGVVFQGVAVNDRGKPLRGVSISVRKIVNGQASGRWSARSDGSGRFRVSGVERDAEYRLIASRGGYHTVVQSGLRSGQRGMRLELRSQARR